MSTLREAGAINSWWDGDAHQRYWLEITDRADLGVDVHCPQRDSVGNRTPGYSLIWWLETGDAVLHYDRNQRAIVAWSRVSGPVTEGPTEWLSHRGETRRRIRVPRVLDGWWRDLDGPFLFSEPLTLERLRKMSDAVRSVLDELKRRHQGALYFPFFFWGGRELRPMQPYLNKLPVELVELFPQLSAATVADSTSGRAAITPDALGVDYREASLAGPTGAYSQ